MNEHSRDAEIGAPTGATTIGSDPETVALATQPAPRRNYPLTRYFALVAFISISAAALLIA